MGRTAASLAVVMLAFGGYWMLAVPWIEPQLSLPSVSINMTGNPVAGESQAALPKGFAAWFAEGAWERGEPIVLESAQARLMLKKYHNRQDGTVEIHPCTIVLLPSGRTAGSDEWIRKAIVLQAPEGAVLQFDKPIDFRRGEIGTLVGGRLMGPITIRSDGQQPGPEDDLRIAARDAVLARQSITSPHVVQFRMGNHRGSGRGLHIELTPGAARGSEGSGIRWLELHEAVQMHIDLADLERRRAADQPEPATGSPNDHAPTNSGPLSIRCAGPFRFDFEQTVATFRDQVEVVRHNADAPSDTLNGDFVAIHFSAAEGMADRSKPAGPTRISKLDPERLEARGNPVIVRAPSSAAEAIGQQMTYNLRTGQASLRGQREVLLRRGDTEIHAPVLHFQPGQSGAWGNFSASGPGRLRSSLPDDSATRFSAHWNKSLFFVPHEGVPLISLLGKAGFSMQGQGEISGEEIYLWLREATPRESSATPHTSQPTTGRLEPDRMMARGNVRFQMAQLSGTVNELQAWFETIEPPIAAAVSSSPNRRGDHRGSTAVATAREEPNPAIAPLYAADVGSRQGGGVFGAAAATAGATDHRPRFHVEAGKLQVELRRDEIATKLTALRLSDSVRITELWTEKVTEKPLRLSGDEIEVQAQDGNGHLVTLRGTPARVTARSMAIEGGTIQLDRAANRLAVEGPGKMVLPADRDLEGRAVATPQPLEISWQRHMRFDGRTARFEDAVTSRMSHRTIHTETMDVDFLQRLDLNNPPRDQRPELKRITCRGGVFIKSLTYTDGRLTSIEQLRAGDLSIHRPSGEITAEGPGSLTLVQRGTTSATSGLGARSGTLPKTGNRDGLSYLGVEFRRGLAGNLNERSMTFYDRIVTVFGPVDSWGDQISPDVFDDPDPQGMLMHCDELKVVQLETAGGRHAELEASGNATVESGAFYARADKMRYAEAKDLVVLEGIGRGKAELWRQLRAGTPQSGTAARKILYWRSTGHVEVNDAERFDLNLLSSQQSTPPQGP